MSEQCAWLSAFGIVGVLTVIRVVLLHFSPLDLYPDEAQYWWWAIHPALGYFSKPPLIAWLIRVSLVVCGDGEACIRVGAPLLHGATALVLFAIARRLYDAPAALLSSVLYILLPGVAYSATLISTDVPLLFCWAVALYAFVRLWQAGGTARSVRWTILLGIAVGFGLLAKYAMAYFLLGLLLATSWLPEVRRAIANRFGALAAVIALALFAPNVWWNLAHGFATAGHLATNADWINAKFNLSNLGEFFGSQFGVFGPITLAIYGLSLWRVGRTIDLTTESRLLVCFSLPPLILIAFQAFIAEANANWAATAYVAAIPLVARTLLGVLPRWSLFAALVPNALIALAIAIFTILPAVADAAGLSNAYKRMHGWNALGAKVGFWMGGYSALVVDNRSVIAELLYYVRPRAIPVYMWDRDLINDNQFDMTMRLPVGLPGPMLLVTAKSDPATELATFETVRLVTTLEASLGAGHQRELHLYAVDGYRGPGENETR